MPQLPTLTVTQAQADKLLSVFNNDPAQYKEWLRQQLVEKVLASEAATFNANRMSEEAAQMEAVRNSLPHPAP